MSRTGCCYDNAAMERFFWSLKHEWTNHDTFANLEEARLSVFNADFRRGKPPHTFDGGGVVFHVFSWGCC